MADKVEDTSKKQKDQPVVGDLDKGAQQAAATAKLSESTLGQDRGEVLKEADRKQAQDLLGKIKNVLPETVVDSSPKANTDSSGRVTDVQKGDLHRSFAYENPAYPNLITSFNDNGNKYAIDKTALAKGQVVYVNEDASKSNDVRKGIFTAESDGSMTIKTPSGFEFKDRLDGSKVVKLETGATLEYRADGKLDSLRDANGLLTTFKYEMNADLFGRKGQLSAITTGEGKDAVTQRSSDGFNWKQDGTGKEWKGFITANPGDGSILYRDHHGDAKEKKLDGTLISRPDLAVNIDSATDEIRKTVDYWYNSNAIKDIRPQLQGRTAEEIQMIKEVYAERQGRDLRNDLWDRFDHGSDSHRWAEVEGFLNKRATSKDGTNAEESAIRLEVDAKEMNRWWWNRDRSKSAITESTRMVLGTSTETERKNIHAAYENIYQKKLDDLYNEGGDGNSVKNWDAYTQTLINTSLKEGKDVRTAQKEAEILKASLSGGLSEFMEASGAITSEKGRKEFLAEDGSTLIKNAFSTNGDGATESTDEWAVRQANDFAETGALRPNTAIEKASGIFSNDDNVIRETLEKLSPEQRLQFADGKALVEKHIYRASLSTDKEREAFDFYTKMQSSFESLHYFGKARKAEKYEDAATHQGGTDIAAKIVPIGNNWTNSSQLNANAIESMDESTFSNLMTGARVNANSPFLSDFHKEMATAMEKNLGSAYLKDARDLLDKKINEGLAINTAADNANLAELRNKIPQLANIPEDKFAQLSEGYKLEQQLRNNSIVETALRPDQTKLLDDYRKDKILTPFMDGREVARQLDEIASGERAERLFRGREAAESGRTANATEQKDIDFYKQNAAEIDGLSRNLMHEVIGRQKESFLKQLSPYAAASLESYKKTLYSVVQESSRRDILTSIKDNESFWGNNRKAMLESLLSLNADEREKIKTNKDNYSVNLREELKNKFAGGSLDDPRYKLVDSILKQIESSDKKIPDAAVFGATEKLLALAAGIPDYNNKDAVALVSETLNADKDGKLASQLSADNAFKTAATAALGGNADRFESLIKPLLDNGRLSTAQLIERNTDIAENAEGPSTTIFHEDAFFKEAVLEASTRALKLLNSPEGKNEKEQILERLKSSPNLQKLAEEIIKQGEVRPEDRIRAFALGAGTSKEVALQTMQNMKEPERLAMQKHYEEKYGNFRASVLAAVGENKDYDEFFRATRSHDWTTQQAFLNALNQVIKTNDGIGGALARIYNVNDLQDLHKFAQLKFDAATKGQELDPKTQEKIEQLVEHSVRSFKDTKQATADTLVTGAITTGSLALAPFTGGTSLYGLMAISATMGTTGAGLKYALMGNDVEGTRQFLGDTFKYTALAFANQLGTNQVSKAFGFGESVATTTASSALTKAGLDGASAELKEQVENGMLRLVQEGFDHGGVANKAIEEMVQSIEGLSTAAKANLSTELQAALPNAVKAEMEGAVAQILQTMKLRGQSLAYQALVGGSGNVIGEAGREAIDNGKLDASDLQSAFVQGAVFAGAIGTVLTGAGWVSKQVGNTLKDTDIANIASNKKPAARTGLASGISPTAIESTAHLKKPELGYPGTGATASNQLKNILEQTHTPEAPHLVAAETHPLLINESLHSPTIEKPGALELERLNKTVPELNNNVAAEFSERLSKVREGWTEDLNPQLEQAKQLQTQLNAAHGKLESDMATLQASKASPAEIEAAKLDAKHPLNQTANVFESNQKWKTLAESHAGIIQEIKEVTNRRMQSLQEEINNFTIERNLPHVDLHLSEQMHAAGGYSFGDGIITIPRSSLLEANGTFGLSKVAFHELVHASSQDPLIIRNAQRMAAAEGKSNDAEAIKAHYKQSTGRDLSDKWLNEVSKQSKDSPALNATEIARAESLAKAVKESRTDVAFRSEELGNNYRVIESRLNDLKANSDGKAVERLFNDLYLQPGGDRLAARLFSQLPPSPELEQAIRNWHDSKGSTSAQAFDSEASRQILIKQLSSEAEHVQTSNRKLIEGYSSTAIEREAYGLDSQVAEPIGKRPNAVDATRIDSAESAAAVDAHAPINESLRRGQPESLSEELTNLAAPSAASGDIAQREAVKVISRELIKRRMFDWQLSETSKHSTGDRAGIDVILRNKKTGEWYPLDITLRDKERKTFAITIPEDGKYFAQRRLTSDGEKLIVEKLFGDKPGTGIFNEQKALSLKLKQLDDMATAKYGRSFREIIQDPLSATDTELRLNTLRDLSGELAKDPAFKELHRYVSNAKEYVERELLMNKSMKPAFEAYVSGGTQLEVKGLSDNITIREDGQLVGYKLEAGEKEAKEILGGDVVESLRNSVKDMRAKGNLDAAAETRLQSLETRLAEIENRQTKIANLSEAVNNPNSSAARSVLKSEASSPIQIKQKADQLIAVLDQHLAEDLGTRDSIHWQGVKDRLENIRKNGAVSGPDELKAFMEVRLAQETHALRAEFKKDIMPIVASNLNWNEYANEITKQAAFANNPATGTSVAELIAHKDAWNGRTVQKGEDFLFTPPVLKDTLGSVPVEIQPGAKYQGTRLSYKDQFYAASNIEYLDKATNEFVISSSKGNIRIPAKDSKFTIGIPVNGDASTAVYTEAKHLNDILKSKETVDAEIARLTKERPGLHVSTELLKMRARKLFNADNNSVSNMMAEIARFDGSNPEMLRRVAQEWDKIPKASQESIIARIADLDDAQRAIARANLAKLKDMSVDRELADWINM